MPLYEYRCGACQRPFELLVRSDTLVACPACGSRKVERLMSVPAPSRSTGAATDFSKLGPPTSGGCCGGGGCGCH